MEGVICVEVDGIPVRVERAALGNDLETLELLADVDDGNVLAAVRLMRHIFGEEQYRAIKSSLARDGRVTIEDAGAFLQAFFEAVGDTAKN